MSEPVSNILLILANPNDDQDKRLSKITNLCQDFGQYINSKNVNVDSLELYKEEEFLSGEYLDSNNSKVLEYQIRINKADMIVIFHPVFLDGIPAVLKGFLENILTVNFAFKTESRISIPLLTNKKCLVVAFDSRPVWQSKFVFGNQLHSFWNKTIFELTGIDGHLHIFGSFRSTIEKDTQKWRQKVISLANNIKIKPNVLDI